MPTWTRENWPADAGYSDIRAWLGQDPAFNISPYLNAGLMQWDIANRSGMSPHQVMQALDRARYEQMFTGGLEGQLGLPAGTPFGQYAPPVKPYQSWSDLLGQPAARGRTPGPAQFEGSRPSARTRSEDIQYYGPAGQPYAGEDYSYWQTPQGQWQQGTKALAGSPEAVTDIETPPWLAAPAGSRGPGASGSPGGRTQPGEEGWIEGGPEGRGGTVDQPPAPPVDYEDLLSKLTQGGGLAGLQPGALTLAALLGQQQPQSWLQPGMGYGDLGWNTTPTGRTTYFNPEGKPYQLGSQQPSYWYNLPGYKWQTGDISGKVSDVPYENLPWVENPPAAKNPAFDILNLARLLSGRAGAGARTPVGVPAGGEGEGGGTSDWPVAGGGADWPGFDPLGEGVGGFDPSSPEYWDQYWKRWTQEAPLDWFEQNPQWKQDYIDSIRKHLGLAD